MGRAAAACVGSSMGGIPGIVTRLKTALPLGFWLVSSTARRTVTSAKFHSALVLTL